MNEIGDIKIFSNTRDEECIHQIIETAKKYPNSHMRIMPDYHLGKECVIGTTMIVKDEISPNIVGVDIGCGLLGYEIPGEVNFEKLDEFIRLNIPFGNSIRKEAIDKNFQLTLYAPFDKQRASLSLGTLGGGNHFIEVGSNGDKKMLFIHSGSRFLGTEVATWYQNHISGPRGTLRDDLLRHYLEDMKQIVEYAENNRRTMARLIIEKFLKGKFSEYKEIKCIHNYIEPSTHILRKGAISAKKGEVVLIPLNMRDGVILAKGKGNSDWNYSAPHGAGRLYSRTEAKERISLEDFKEAMKKVYSTCVSQKTVDESPFAYKPAKEILEAIKDTVEVIDIYYPLFNFKA